MGSDVAQLTIRQAADALGVSMDTIRRHLRSGQLTGQRVDIQTGKGATSIWYVDVPDDAAVAPARKSSRAGKGQPADDTTGPAATSAGGSSALAAVTAERDRLRDQLALIARQVDDTAAERDRVIAERDRLLGIIETLAATRPAAAQPTQGAEPVNVTPTAPGASGPRAAWRVLWGRG